jgi:hypothetical protein
MDSRSVRWFSSSILAPPRQAEGGFMTVNVTGAS